MFRTLRWNKRRLEVRRMATEQIKGEGGRIEAIGIIGLMLKSPFRPLSIEPVYLKLTARYSDDWGHWYICASRDGHVQWVWKSANGRANLPVTREHEVKVDNSVWALPEWLSILLWIVFFAAAVSIPLWI